MFRVILAAVLAFSALSGVGCSKDREAAKREYLSSGDAYFEQKKYAEAVVEYRNAIQQDPKFGQARYKLAESYISLNKPADAYREYIRAADLMPDNVEAQVKAARMLLMGGQFLDAQSRAEKALAVDPKSIDAQLLKGAVARGHEEARRSGRAGGGRHRAGPTPRRLVSRSRHSGIRQGKQGRRRTGVQACRRGESRARYPRNCRSPTST